MKKILAITLMASCCTCLVSCQSKQGAGTAIGAITGGILGSHFGKGSGQLLGVGIGMMAGAVIGSEIGKSLDEYDRKLMQNSSQQALEYAPSGQAVEWKNPDSGHYGSITPIKTVKVDNAYCREYQQKIVVGGKEEMAYGKACRQPDGQWKIVK